LEKYGDEQFRGSFCTMTLDPSKRDGLPPADAKFLQIIEEYGWHVMTVAPRVGDDAALWAYSTGLYYSYGHPEIILFNLKADTLPQIINTIGQSVKTGKKFEPGPTYADVFDNYQCSFRAVDSSQYEAYVGFSLWFYESSDFPILQCFWPDKSHRFPWEPPCEDWVREAQPLLYLPEKT
jgi:Domain of unknown function (DUF4262)